MHIVTIATLGAKYKLRSSSLYYFIKFPATSSFLGPCRFRVRRCILNLYKTHKILILYTLNNMRTFVSLAEKGCDFKIDVTILSTIVLILFCWSNKGNYLFP